MNRLYYGLLIFLISSCLNNEKKLYFNEEEETIKIFESVIDTVVKMEEGAILPSKEYGIDTLIKIKVFYIFIDDTFRKDIQKYLLNAYRNNIDRFGEKRFNNTLDSAFHDLLVELDSNAIYQDKIIKISQKLINEYKIYPYKDLNKIESVIKFRSTIINKNDCYILDSAYIAVKNISRVFFNREKNKCGIYIDYSCGFMCCYSWWFFLEKIDNKWYIKYKILDTIC